MNGISCGTVEQNVLSVPIAQPEYDRIGLAMTRLKHSVIRTLKQIRQ